jgi:hypothetical protein
MRARITSELSEVAIAVAGGVLILCSSMTGAADCDMVSITAQPQSQLVAEGCPVILTVGVTGTGPYSYQWWRDGQPVPNGTNSSFSIPVAHLSDNETRVHVAISNDCSQVTSDEVSIMIMLGVTPPTLLRGRGDETLERVIVTFFAGPCGWPGLDPLTAEASSNYWISGGIIVTNALLDASGTNVILSTSRQTPGMVYTLSAKDVADRHLPANRIPLDSTTEFQAWGPLPGSDPVRIVPPPIVIALTDGRISIERPAGSFLEEAERITGSWEAVSDAARPYSMIATNGTRFFRAVFSP